MVEGSNPRIGIRDIINVLTIDVIVSLLSRVLIESPPALMKRAKRLDPTVQLLIMPGL
jgi:hypothetical protein